MSRRRVRHRKRVAGAEPAAHELLHAFNDYFAPDTAPNACEDRGHVCDSTADILSTGTSHPSPRLSDAVLDVGHDDYYDHAGSWWDIRDSALARPPGQPAGHAHRSRSPAPAATSPSTTRRKYVRRHVREAVRRGQRRAAHRSRTERAFDCSRGVAPVPGTVGSCDTTVRSDGTAVTATFGPAVTVTRAQTRGPGQIAQLDGNPCAGECEMDLIPGSQVVIGAQTRHRVRGSSVGAVSAVAREPTCTVAVSLGAGRPSVTAVFRDGYASVS